MYRRILVANRGEVAVRVIRACKELGIETVSIYSLEDRDSLHVGLADLSVCIGEGGGKNNYLNIAKIINVAVLKNCDAIHPGYGFLSENAEFIRACQACGLDFIGPSVENILELGNKARARKIMLENQIPLVPGYEGRIGSFKELKKIAEKIGYPLILKPSIGGGGRGMRIVRREENLEEDFRQAEKEARLCFGSDEIYLEKYIEGAKHIEFQIMGDSFGNIVSLGDRECSIQRKNQKLLEEAPSPSLSQELREKIERQAIKIGKILNYRNLGTIEFLLDRDKNFYFMEVNTRLQVEHTVSEMITGVDIVKEQIRLAKGLPLSFKQEDIRLVGHSIQCRINAEDIANNFMPSSGEVRIGNIPNGFNTRFDSYIYKDTRLNPYFDSMIGKLIVKDSDRLRAIKKMRAGLEELDIKGVSTNIDLHYGILHDREFLKGDYNINFLEERFKDKLEDFYSDIESWYRKNA